jgi:channel protein (hemolysin III family)
VLRRIDHIMIYVLIAGTYTPITLIVLEGFTGWALFTAVWAIAVLGVIFKLVWFNAPKWVSLVLYLAMGWMAVIVFPALWQVFPFSAIRGSSWADSPTPSAPSSTESSGQIPRQNTLIFTRFGILW